MSKTASRSDVRKFPGFCAQGPPFCGTPDLSGSLLTFSKCWTTFFLGGLALGRLSAPPSLDLPGPHWASLEPLRSSLSLLRVIGPPWAAPWTIHALTAWKSSPPRRLLEKVQNTSSPRPPTRSPPKPPPRPPPVARFSFVRRAGTFVTCDSQDCV